VNDETRTPVPEPEANPTVTRAPDLDATRVRPSAQPATASTDGSAGVSGFEIEGTLGRGGMGVVYKAKQVGLNRVVALKMLIAGPYADPSLRARFLLEAESVAALEHPGIVKVFAFGENGSHPYLAMEFLPGGTLAERIKKNGPLSATAATELVAKLAVAVAHAHSRGVVHRDIKPLNVLLTAEGEPRLTDFGLAKVGRADQNLSVTGQVLGTPAYMAPEQAAGKVREVGTGADVYALGALLYDALTGRPPFQGDSVAVTLQKVLTEEPERPRKLNASIPRDLETICLKCLEKDPVKRYARADDLADDLQKFLDGKPISARPCGAAERFYKVIKRNKARAVVVVLLPLVLVLGATLGTFAFGPSTPTNLTDKTDPAAPVRYEDGAAVQLFNPTADNPLAGWWSQEGWNTEKDEGSIVLAGQGPVTHKFNPPPPRRTSAWR
jgi:tRNA A-37 threonylcarbamoyl transferase component Bud32